MGTDVYQTVTDQIIAAIEAGAGQWQMPWHGVGNGLERPVNAATGNAYRGINVLALWASGASRGFTDGTWATFKQWKSRGASVRKGERGTVVAFYKQFDVEVERNGKTETERRMMARASYVFNADQVDGWERPARPAAGSGADQIEAVDAFIRNTGATVRNAGNRAFYSPAHDVITMPPHDQFTGTETSTATESYYATLLHELVHWTGPESRCNREFGKRFGDSAYAMEELVAELGAAFLCADLGISLTPRPDHAAYIDGWLKALKSDKRAIFTAASQAAKATDFVAKMQPGVD